MRSETAMELEPYTRPSLPTLRDLVAVPFRHRSITLATFLLIAIAVAVSGVWLPKYDAQMKILVQRQRSDAMVTSSPEAPAQYNGDAISEEDLNSEVELLTSNDLLRKVVMSTYAEGKPALIPLGANETTIAHAVRKLGKDLKIDAIRKTHVISIGYGSHDPQVTAAVLRTLAAEYTEKHTEVHRPSGEFTFFNQQADRFQRGLEIAQQKVKDFSQQTGVVEADRERDGALQRAEDFDANAHQLHATIADSETRIAALRRQLQSVPARMTTATRTSDNPQLLQQLKSTLLTLELKRTELLAKYEPSYRLVQEVEAQIAETKNAISSEENKPIREQTTDQNPDHLWVQGQLTKAEAELGGLKANEASTRATAKLYRTAAERIEQAGMVQANLLRDVKVQEDGYLLYVHKREEAAISDALDQRGILNVAIAEQPMAPTLPTRSPLYAMLLTLFLATTGSLLAAFVADVLDPSFRTPDEVSRYLGTPVLAALPKASR